MKISQQTISIIGVVIIVLLFFARGPLKTWESDDHYEDVSKVQPNQFDSLNRAIYDTKNKLDSLNLQKENKVNEGYRYAGWTFGDLGLGKLKQRGKDFSDSITYVQLNHIGIDIHDRVTKRYLFYYEKDGQGYLSRTKLIKNYPDTAKTYENGKLLNKKINKIIFEDKKVDYKYSYANKSMLVPISSKFVEVLVTIISYAIILFQLLVGFFIIATFFRFLMYIARNNAFDMANIYRLKDMSIAFMILTVKTFVVNGIIYLIFISQYSSDGVTITYSFWEDDYLLLVYSILCYLIYTAFKRGMILQEESELTI